MDSWKKNSPPTSLPTPINPWLTESAPAMIELWKAGLAWESQAAPASSNPVDPVIPWDKIKE